VLHTQEEVPSDGGGTKVVITMPDQAQDFDPARWAKAFALFNPHASVSINPHASVRFRAYGDGTQHANSDSAEVADSYHSTVDFPGAWRKFLPTDLTSPFWYDEDALKRLVFCHIHDAQAGGRDLPLREFVRQFRGLSGTAKAKAVCDRFPKIRHLSDFDQAEPEIAALLIAMRSQAGKPPSPGILGAIGDEHFRRRLDEWFGVRRWWFRKVDGSPGDVPFVFEVAVAETERPGALFTGINFSPTFSDPFADTMLSCDRFVAQGLRGFLERSHAAPATYYDPDRRIAAAAHLSCPSLTFLDRGKSRLSVP